MRCHVPNSCGEDGILLSWRGFDMLDMSQQWMRGQTRFFGKIFLRQTFLRFDDTFTFVVADVCAFFQGVSMLAEEIVDYWKAVDRPGQVNNSH